MANYGTKYRLGWESRTATCRVDLQKDGYSSGVQALTPARAPLTIRWGEPERPDLTRALMQSEATVRFRGDSTGEAVSEVFDAPDRTWRVVFKRDTGAGLKDEWYGFLKTDEWRDNQRRDSDIVELAAIGGLQLLQNVDYDLAGTDVYSALRTIMRGVHPFNIAANCQWYPYRGGNQIAASSLPLSNLTVGDQAFDELEKIEGEEGFETTGRRSRHRALEAILERFGMRAFQSRGEWIARQRTQIQATGEIKEWPNSTAVANNNPTMRDLTRSLPTPFQIDQPRGLVRRLRTAESRHEYSQLGELVANGSFENGGGSLQNWTGSASVRDYNNVSALSETPTQEDSFVAEVDQGEKVEQDVPAIIHDPGPRSAIQFSFELYLDGVPSDDPFQETRIRLGDYFVQQRTEITDEPVDPTSEDDGRVPLAGPIVGNPDTIVIPRGAELITGSGATITLSEPARGGDEVLRGSVSAALSSPEVVQYYVWSDSPQQVANGTDRFGLFTTTHYPQDVASSGDDPGTVIPNTISLPLNTPTGTRIAEKDLRFAHESFGGFAGSYRSFIDNISAKLVKAGEPIGETSFIALDEQEGEEVELTQIIGDGPTFEHPRALSLPGAPVTRDWKVGGYGSTDARSGQLIEEITAEAAHRQQRETAQRFTENVPLVGSDEIWPHDVFSIGGSLYSVTFLERTFSQEEAVQAELTELKDAGTSGLTRTFEMDTSEAGGGGGGGGLVSGTGGGGGASNWDGLTGELSGPVPFDATDADGNPTSRSLRFLNVTPQVDVTSDPANGIALEIKDQTNGTRLGTLTTDGRWETRADMEAFADGSFGSGSSTNSLLQVEDGQGDVLTTDAASLQFTGSGISLTKNGDEIIIDVSGGSGSDIDIEQNQTPVVGGATGVSFEGSGIDSVDNDGDGTATVRISKGSSTEIQEGGTAQVSDATVLDFVSGDFSVSNPTSGEAEVSLQNDTVTVAGNSVSLGGSTGVNHSDLSGISSNDHHAKTTSAADLTDVSADSVTDAHHTRPSAGDGLSDSSNTFSVNESQVDHDSLNQFVANEHIDHSAVTISAGTALSGGGDLTSSRTLNVSGPLTGIPFKNSGDSLEWQADANNDLILQNTTDAQTLLKVDQDTGTVFAAGDVVAFGLSGSGGSGSTSGLQADAPLTLDTTTDPDTIGLSVGSGLTITNGTLEADESVGVSSVFGRTGDVTASSGDYSASQISGFDEKAQDAVGTIMAGSGAASVTYDDAANTITISATDTNTQLPDSEVQTAINNDADHGSTASHNYYTDSDAISAINNDANHGSTASHNYTTSASGLTDVSPDSDPNAHHAVFEPSDYNPVSDIEAHGNALAIDITGDANTLDGVEGGSYARTDVSETFNSNVGFGGETNPSYAVDVNGTGNFSGDLYAAGSVGIGTTSPSYTLDVNGTAAASTIRLGDYTVEQDSSNGDLNFFHSGSKVLELTDGGVLRAAGDVVAFGLSGGGTAGSTSGLQANAPLTLDTTTDPDTIGLSVGNGLTVNSGTLEANGSVGVSSVFGRTGDVTAQSGDYAHSQISGVSSDDHHTRYSDEEAQDAVGTILTDSGAASVTYDDATNIITISATDTDTQLSDSEVQTAINNDSDHGSTASHNYTTASDLDGTGLTASGGQLDVNEGGIQHDNLSGGTDEDAHHAAFEPADYNPEADTHSRPTTGDGLTGSATFAVDSTVARTNVKDVFEDQIRIDGPLAGSDSDLGSSNNDYVLALGGNPYGIDDADGTGDDRLGSGLLQNAHGTRSDYRTYLQGGHGRVAHTWNAYYDNNASTWRSVVDNEPHTLVGIGNTSPGNVNGGGVTLATADAVNTANADNEQDAEDPVDWNVGIHVDVDGKVGIGDITDPAHALEVGGDINASGVGRFDITGDADTLDTHDASYFGALSENETITGTWEFDGEISVYKSGSPTSSRRMTITRSEIRGDKFTSTDIYARGNNNNEGLILGNSVPGSSDKPMIKAHLNGNVAIGDPPPTSPSYALDVNGTGNFNGSLIVGDTLTVGNGSLPSGNTLTTFDAHRNYEIKREANTSGSAGTANLVFNSLVAGNAWGFAYQNTTLLEIGGAKGINFKNENVGIQTTSPSTTLGVGGGITASGEVEAFGTASDKRLKADLDPLESALDKVEQLTGYGFNWHDKDAVHPRKRGESGVGVVAQEVEDVLPEAVNTFEGGHSEGYKSVSYDKLVPLLVEAIKDLRSQIEQLQ